MFSNAARQFQSTPNIAARNKFADRKAADMAASSGQTRKHKPL